MDGGNRRRMYICERLHLTGLEHCFQGTKTRAASAETRKHVSDNNNIVEEHWAKKVSPRKVLLNIIKFYHHCTGKSVS